MTHTPIYYAYIYASGVVKIGRRVPHTAMAIAQSPSRSLLRYVLQQHTTYRGDDEYMYAPLDEATPLNDIASALGDLALIINQGLSHARGDC